MASWTKHHKQLAEIAVASLVDAGYIEAYESDAATERAAIGLADKFPRIGYRFYVAADFPCRKDMLLISKGESQRHYTPVFVLRVPE